MAVLTSEIAAQLIAEQGVDIVIPNTYTSIESRAFYVKPFFVDLEWGTPITSVIIPESVTAIGDWAFFGNNLTNITIPASVNSIGSNAFTYNRLTSISMPNSEVELGEEVFDDSINGDIANQFILDQGKELTIPGTYEFIGAYIFSGDELTSVSFGEGVTRIYYNAFEDNNLTEVFLPDSVTDVQYCAFCLNPLERVSISSETAFNQHAFPDDTVIFIRGFDDDDDGFVDEVTNYRMWTEFGGVDLTNRRGRTYSDNTSRKWDAIKAVEVDHEFSVLVEGYLSKEGKYKVVTADDEGVIVGATRWLNGNQMFDEGYEDLFAMDFNGNNRVGY